MILFTLFSNLPLGKFDKFYKTKIESWPDLDMWRTQDSYCVEALSRLPQGNIVQSQGNKKRDRKFWKTIAD